MVAESSFWCLLERPILSAAYLVHITQVLSRNQNMETYIFIAGAVLSDGGKPSGNEKVPLPRSVLEPHRLSMSNPGLVSFSKGQVHNGWGELPLFGRL